MVCRRRYCFVQFKQLKIVEFQYQFRRSEHSNFNTSIWCYHFVIFVSLHKTITLAFEKGRLTHCDDNLSTITFYVFQLFFYFLFIYALSATHSVVSTQITGLSEWDHGNVMPLWKKFTLEKVFVCGFASDRRFPLKRIKARAVSTLLRLRLG